MVSEGRLVGGVGGKNIIGGVGGGVKVLGWRRCFSWGCE